MVLSYTEDFQVTWQDPAEGERTWMPDLMHFPRPLPLFSHGLLKKVIEEMFGGHCTFVNGYAYMRDYGPPPPTPEIMEIGALAAFNDVLLPRWKASLDARREHDYDSMSAHALAAALPGYVDEVLADFRPTMEIVFPFMAPTMELVGFSEKVLGPDGPRLVASLLQGYDNGSSASGNGLSALAETAARYPAVADALRNGRYEGLEALEGGSEFGAEFQSFLDEFGWRLESWSLIHLPTWAEDPRTPLMLIGHYLRNPDSLPSASIERSAIQRDEALKAVESRLQGADLEQFRGMLEAAKSHVYLSEGRALWQLMILGSIRAPMMAMGRKLVGAGVCDQPDDVFFLTLAETQALAAKPEPVQPMIAERRLTLLKQEQMVPPPFIGPPPSDDALPPEVQAMFKHFFGGGPPSIQGRVISGKPASKGAVRGRARVIKALADAGRLEQGDILVCTTTAPPWTPLFAIAGAVVTDTGGILSHSAICAREYAIPCVVGTQVATSAIPEGAMITVDGSAGTVTIEG